MMMLMNHSQSVESSFASIPSEKERKTTKRTKLEEKKNTIINCGYLHFCLYYSFELNSRLVVGSKKKKTPNCHYT